MKNLSLFTGDLYSEGQFERSLINSCKFKKNSWLRLNVPVNNFSVMSGRTKKNRVYRHSVIITQIHVAYLHFI